MRKKLFTFLLALVTSVGLSWATDPIVISTNTGQSSYTQGDITITCSKPGTDSDGFYLQESGNETATITNSGSSTISQIELEIGWFPQNRSYVRANGAEPTSSDQYSITFSNVNSNNVTLTITNEKIQIRNVTITLADEGGSASAVTAARFVYNYDCQRNPAYPKKETACTLSGFKDPLEGYKGTKNGNIALGPWKLEFVAYYTPSNNYGCASQVNSAVYQYYSNLSSQEREAKKLEMPIFRLWQYNLTAREYQHAAYGIVCAYAGEANAQDHGALFISSGSWGCFLSGHQHSTSFALTCENDLTTGLTALVDAASAPSDPYYDVVWPVIVSIDAIGPVELSEHCKYYIEGSRAAYNALTDEQKAQVTNYSTLTNAETQWAALAAAAQPYADAVIDLINAIPNPVVYTQECKDAIDAAQAAYNALTDGQKVLVTNAETLLQAPIAFINVAHPNILFTADNSNIKRIEDVTLPKSFTAGYFSTDNEFLGILKELYGINEDAYINFIYSNNDAVTRSGNNLTVNPFSGTATVSGNIVIMSTSNDSPYSVNITLELPPFGPASTPNSITINESSHGSVVASSSSAAAGETITLTATPDDGYQLKSISGVYETQATSNETLNATSETVNGNKFQAQATSRNLYGWRVYNPGTANTLTVSSKDGATLIEKIEFTSTFGNGRTNDMLSVSEGTLSFDENVPSTTVTINDINATSVTISGSGNNAAKTWCIASVKVYYEGTEEVELEISDTENANVKTFTMVDSEVTIIAEFEPAPTPTAVVIGDPNNASEVETFLSTYDGQTIDELIIDRPVLNNMYNTLCLPFNMNAAQIAASSLNGVEIREFTGASVEGTTLNLSVGDPVNAVVAGRPYFVKYSAPSQLDDLHFEEVTINNAILDDEAVTFDGVTFKGTFTPFVMPNGLNFQGGYLFLGQNNQLFWPGTSNPLKPFRAYFYVDVESSTPGNAPKYRGMPARIVEGKNVATGVENANLKSEIKNQKFIKDGQLIIIRNGVEYSVDGKIVK